MNQYPTLIRILTLALLCSLSLLILPASGQNEVKNFITRSGNKLMDGEKEFRFLSINMPTLNYNEDEFAFNASQPFSLPDEFEIRDAFETYKQIGGQVVRIYTIPVRMEMEPADVPTYVEAPGVFNETAFKTLDMVLAYANQYHVRVIIPFVNNWDAFGGKPQYEYFRNAPKDAFWTDKQLMADVKKTIAYVLNRRNTITGQLYKDDKAILCWETGNELRSPESWTVEICRYIKSIDSNHLVMDGFYAIDKQNYVQEYAMEEPSIDIVSSHHYDSNPTTLLQSIDKNLSVIKGRRPYIVGEIGFSSTSGTEKVFDAFIANHDISGALVWGLRNHRSKGGFYWHSEGDTRFKSYHWPGFDSGNEYDAKNFIHMLRAKAFEIRGMEVPEIPVPHAPVMLPVEHPGLISWKGSTSASSYDVYRSESIDGQWEKIGCDVSDANKQYFPMFADNTAQPGKTYYYRMTAKNCTGSSGFSAVSNAVKVENKLMSDDMENYSLFIYHGGKIAIETADDRKYKEDMFRVSGDKGSSLVYSVPGQIDSVRVYSFCSTKCQNLELFSSGDDANYQIIQASPEAFYGNGSYYQVPLYYVATIPKSTVARYLKIAFLEQSQISRIELFYH